MLRLIQITTKTTRCAIVFAHMTSYDVIQSSRSTKKCQKRSQDTQDYELRSANAIVNMKSILLFIGLIPFIGARNTN